MNDKMRLKWKEVCRDVKKQDKEKKRLENVRKRAEICKCCMDAEMESHTDIDGNALRKANKILRELYHAKAWFNPIWALSWEGNKFSDELCNDCSYSLEHTIYGEENCEIR